MLLEGSGRGFLNVLLRALRYRNHVLKVSEWKQHRFAARACMRLPSLEPNDMSFGNLSRLKQELSCECNVLEKLLPSKFLSYLPFVSHLLHAYHDEHHRQVTLPSAKTCRENLS